MSVAFVHEPEPIPTDALVACANCGVRSYLLLIAFRHAVTEMLLGPNEMLVRRELVCEPLCCAWCGRRYLNRYPRASIETYPTGLAGLVAVRPDDSRSYKAQERV